MGELKRVPLARPMRWITDDEVKFTIPPTARRFYFDVSEEAIGRFGANVIQSALDELGRTLPHLYSMEIQSAVDSILKDRKWLEPIIEGEIRQRVREFAAAIWNTPRY